MSTLTPSFVTPPVSDRGRSPWRLLSEALRRPGGRRSLSVLSVVLLLAGVGLLAYPLGTDLYSKRVQGDLRQSFAGDPQVSVQYAKRTIPVGDGLTELVIPRLGVDVLVVEGTTPSALRAGAGHYAGPLPGEPGNVSIAGHRTTFGRPFNRLDELGPKDEVILRTPFAAYTYAMVAPRDFGGANPRVVEPTDVSVIEPGDGSEQTLTLTTCHPKGSAAKRLILRLRLVRAEALPGKTLPPGTQLGARGTPQPATPDGSLPSG